MITIPSSWFTLSLLLQGLVGVQPASSTALTVSLTRIPEGKWTAVARSSERVEGYFVGVTGDSVILEDLDGARLPIALGDITAVWTRGNAMGRGMIVGAVPPAVFGALLGLLVAALDESGEYDAAATVIVGGLAGVAVGGLVGGGVGATIPSWKQVYPPGGEVEPLSYPATRRPVMGVLTIQGGYAGILETGGVDSQFGGRIGISTRLSRSVSLGPEFGLYVPSDTDEPSLHFNALIRGEFSEVPLYVYGGPGYYHFTRSGNFFGLGLGVGMNTPTRPAALAGEVRVDTLMLGDTSSTHAPTMLSVTLGGLFRW